LKAARELQHYPAGGEDKMISRFCRAGLLGAALLVPVSTTAIAWGAEPRVYHDGQHNDDHKWDAHEDRAYRIWAKQNHRKYRDFGKLREEDRQAYWGWRHEHSDAVLNINIR
jgi:hypothetical protein